MANATQRREKRDAQRLQALALREPDQFKREWERRLRGWLGEISWRARDAARDSRRRRGHDPHVFGVLEKAQRLLALCGSEARTLVESNTLDALRNECARATAGFIDPRLYRLGNGGSNVELMKLGMHDLPRWWLSRPGRS
jgi:hypothetical protein